MTMNQFWRLYWILTAAAIVLVVIGAAMQTYLLFFVAIVFANALGVIHFLFWRCPCCRRHLRHAFFLDDRGGAKFGKTDFCPFCGDEIDYNSRINLRF